MAAQIQIVAIGTTSRDLIEYLSLTLPETAGRSCSVSSKTIDPTFALNTARRQYNSSFLLTRLLALDIDPSSKILGVAEVDLFIPILTFVFGEAQLAGWAAVISTLRLQESFYGLPDNQRLLFERAEKEAAHQLGHVLGLVHCVSFDCVMHYSNSISEVDIKGSGFCAACSKRI